MKKNDFRAISIASVAAFAILVTGCGNGGAAPNDLRMMETIAETTMEKCSSPGPRDASKVIGCLRTALDQHGYSLKATLKEVAESGVSMSNPRDVFILAIVESQFEELGPEKTKTLFLPDEYKFAQQVLQHSTSK